MQELEDLDYLNLSNSNLFVLPNLTCYKNLKTLICNYNKLTTLDNLPSSITHLYCYYNRIVNLDKLPNSIYSLICDCNQIVALDHLPSSIIELFCKGNQIVELDHLPSSITHLYCEHNQIVALDHLPSSITHLQCNMNPFTYAFEATLDNIKIYNRFRFLFYLIKFSKRFKRFHLRFRLNRCNKYKEELIMKMFHPIHVQHFLQWGFIE